MHIGPFYPNGGVCLTQPMGKNGPVEENSFIAFYRKTSWFSFILRSVCVVIPKYSSSIKKKISSHFLFRSYEESNLGGPFYPTFPYILWSLENLKNDNNNEL